MPESRLDIDDPNKLVRIVGPINKQMGHDFRNAIQRLDELTRAATHTPGLAKKLPEGWAKLPITVEIDSPGGDLYAGLMMYTEMRKVATPVTTLALQQASSAALVVLVGGDTRECYPHVLAVDHQLTTQFKGTTTQFIQFVDHIKALQAEVNEIFDLHCGDKLPDEVKQAAALGDKYLDAKELLEYGFVDRVIQVHLPGAKPWQQAQPAVGRGTMTPLTRGPGLTVVPGGQGFPVIPGPGASGGAAPETGIEGVG